MTPIQTGIAGIVVLVVLLMSSMPVAYVMGIVGFVGFSILASPTAALKMLPMDLHDTFANYTLSVIPLFVLMGQICFHSGISGRLFSTAYCWMGRLPGGMAMATVGACTAFGAICGSGPATTATMSLVALPEMKRYKYDPELAAGTVAAGGTLGMLIPPSVVFIVYAILTEQSIGKLFIAGILPGLMIATMFCAMIYWNCRRNPALGPAGPRTTWGQKLRSIGGVTETLLLFLLVIGGMFTGVFTPTEAAAVGAAGSLIVAAFKRALTWKMLLRSLQETVRTSCMVMMIVAGAIMFGHFLAISTIPFALAAWLSGLPLPAWVIIVFIIFFYLVAGCFVDALAAVLLTVPIFAPVVIKLGYDPIWLGVIIVVVTQMGTISPPVGVCSYVVSGIDRDIPLATVFRGIMPFLYTLIVAALILMVFPSIATVLPNLIMK
jgi:C4-dicarboxylate transporter, DctM subunit